MKLTTKNYYRLAVSAFFFIMGLTFSTWACRIPDIKKAMELTEAGLGAVLLFIPIGQLSVLIFLGKLIEKYGSKLFTIISAIFFPFTLILIGLAKTPAMLSGALFFFGMGCNMFNISVNTQGVGVQKIYGRSIMATFHGLWSVAGFLGGLVGSLLASGEVAPLRHFSIILGLCCVLNIIFYRWLMPRDKSRKDYLVQEFQAKPKTKLKFAMPERIIIILGVIVFSNLACEGTMMDWSGVYFEKIIQPSEQYVRLGYIAALSTMALGRFLADKLVMRLGYIRVLLASGALVFMGLMLAVCLPYLIPATLGFMLVGFGVSAVVPICYSIAGRITSVSAGVALTTVSSIGFFGFLVAPPVIGFIAELSNLRWSLAVMAVVGLLAAALAPMLKKEKVKL
ncbi:MAG: MFS transporter [Rikenellaceae bacterium]